MLGEYFHRKKYRQKMVLYKTQREAVFEMRIEETMQNMPHGLYS